MGAHRTLAEKIEIYREYVKRVENEPVSYVITDLCAEFDMSKPTMRAIVARCSKLSADEMLHAASPGSMVDSTGDVSLLSQILDRLDRIESRQTSPFIHTPDVLKLELTQDTTVEFFISDTHFHPQHDQGHDPAAWAVIEQALRENKPDIVFLGGDIFDFYAPSRYEKVGAWATEQAFREELEYGRRKLEEIRDAAPDARIIWLEGNHEARLPRSVRSNAPWLEGIIGSIETHLSMGEYDIEVVPDGYQIGKLRHYHGDRNPGAGRVNTAKNKFDKLLTNMIFGHHHRFSKWIQRNPEGGYYGAYGNACCQWLSADFAVNNEWHQGFSVVEYARSGTFRVDQVLIHKPSIWSPHAEAIYNGTLYKTGT